MIVPEGSGGAQAPSASDRGYMYIEGGAAGGSKEVEISRVIAAGPRTVTDAARIVGADAQGNTIVLREGNDGFTCQLAISYRPPSPIREWSSASMECWSGSRIGYMHIMGIP